MIFTNYYFESSSLPKYILPVAEMMKSVKQCVFVNDGDFSLLVNRLRKKLNECTPKGSVSSIDYSNGQVSVYIRQTDNSILRLGYMPVRGFLKFSKEANEFENVCGITFNEEDSSCLK